MIVDASVVIDALCDPGRRGEAARSALGALPPAEPLAAPGHFATEVMSAMRVAATRPDHPFGLADIERTLHDAESLEIVIEATPWSDVHRAVELADGSLRCADALYVAAAERHRWGLLTSDARIERSGAAMRCPVITVNPDSDSHAGTADAGGADPEG